MTEANVDPKLITELLHRLITAQEAPGTLHTCPICDGQLNIQFQAYERGFGATADCIDCGGGAALDIASPAPAWFESMRDELE